MKKPKPKKIKQNPYAKRGREARGSRQPLRSQTLRRGIAKRRLLHHLHRRAEPCDDGRKYLEAVRVSGAGGRLLGGKKGKKGLPRSN